MWSVGVKIGVCILIVAGGLSLISTAIVLGIIATSAYKSRRDKSSFGHSHLAAYFFCLLLCDAIEGASSILSFDAVRKGMIVENEICITQGVLKQLGMVGAALWLLVIAVHTFLQIFYDFHPSRRAFVLTLFATWMLILAIMLTGPVFLQRFMKGPSFYGYAGYWCWITSPYAIGRYTLHYTWQFLSALVSLLLYVLIFFKIRQNIRVEGWCFYFQRRPTLAAMALTNSKTRLSVVQKVARRMMLYPIVYIIFLLPQAVVRFLTFTGHGASIPTGISLSAAFLLWSNGLIDATLFILTRPSVTAGRTFFPRSLRPFFGLSPDDGDQAQPITLHQSSAQGASNPSMGQAGGINILVSVERQHDGGPDARTVPLRAAWKRPTGLHGTVASLAHHDRNSFSATAYSTHQDRRKISFEDERVGRPSNVSESKWSDDTHEEKDFIQPPPAPTPVAPSLPQRVITIGYNEGSDWQTGVYDGRPTIRHPYNL